MPKAAEVLFETPDVARAAGVVRNTVAYWTETGKLTALHTVSGRALYRAQDVQRFLRGRVGQPKRGRPRKAA